MQVDLRAIGMDVLLYLIWLLLPLWLPLILLGWLWSRHRQTLAVERLRQWAAESKCTIMSYNVPFMVPFRIGFKVKSMFWPFGDRFSCTRSDLYTFHVVLAEEEGEGHMRERWVVLDLRSRAYEVFSETGEWTAH